MNSTRIPGNQEGTVWYKLKARHYAILVLISIVALETSAIAIDRLLSRGSDVAFEVETKFRNNPFVRQFQMAEAKTGRASVQPSEMTAIPLSALSSRPSSTQSTKKTPNVPAKVNPTTPAVSQTREMKPLVATIDPPAQWIEFPVRKGDSLTQIAAMFSVDSAKICAANGMTKEGTRLKAGEKIKIPLDEPRFTYGVAQGDSLSRIATRFGLSIQDLIKENRLKNNLLVEGQKISIPVRKKETALPMVAAAKEQVPIEKKDVPPMVSQEKPMELVQTPKIPIVKPTEPAGNSKVAVQPETPSGKTMEKAVAQATPANNPSPTAKSEPTASAADPRAIAKVESKPTVAASIKTPAKAEPKPTEAGEDTKLVVHTVKKGENLASIARSYKTSITQILSANSFNTSSLKQGQQIKVPVSHRFYRVLQVTSRRANVTTKWSMPVRGRLNDRFGWRVHPIWHRRLFHAGIDISAPRGSPITAAMGGTVVYAGWMSGYGKLVVIRHPNGLSSRYGHCSSFRVKKGQNVRAGQAIAGVGATGTATGNHLHFEIRQNGKPVNPTKFLFGR